MAENIGNVVAEKAVESLIDSISTQLGYIWNYKSNFENLERQLRNLQGRKDMVQHSVDEAERNGEEIEQQVVNWFDGVNKMIDEVTQIIDDNKKAEMKCFKSLCPNLKKRYQYSKNAAVKAKEVSQLHDEGKFERISYRTIPKETWHPSSKHYEDFESRMSTLMDVIKALRRPDINVVGVHGMGGIGKTTLAREVGRKAEEDTLFDSVVFVEVSEQPDVMKIQEAIADRLSLKFSEKSPSGRARILCERLKKERTILLILDNIWQSLDLEKVGIPLNDDHRGCKLLLTARDKNVLLKMDCQSNFSVGILNEIEAWNLFEKMAGSCVQHHDLHPLAIDVAKRCGGLPIAIVTIAKALKDRHELEWRNALLELQRPSPGYQDESVTQEAYSCILLSYKHLKSDELKSTFLLCCTMVLISDASVEVLLRYGLGLDLFKTVKTMEEARNRVNILIGKLKDSSLLLGTSNDECFSIHDVVRDVGKIIASNYHGSFIVDDIRDLLRMNTLEMCTSISLLNIGELPRELNCTRLTFLCMKTETEFSVPHNFFNGMPKLEVLHLEGMDLSELPASLPSLEKLRALYLDWCKLGNIAIIGDIKNLEILVLFNSQSEEKLLSEEIGKLNRLRLLDLRESSFVIPPKTISRLSQLEELYMDAWYDQRVVKDLHIETSVASLEELKDLCHLTALHICVADAEVLPKSMVFERLKRYKIIIEDNFVFEFERDWAIEETSRTLWVRSNTNLCSEDGVIKQLKGIEDLMLDGEQRITNVLCKLDGEGFLKLKNFHIRNNPFILCIVDSMLSATCVAFPLLETLSLQNLAMLEKICYDQLRSKCFCKLRAIKVENCHKLKNLFSLSIAKHLQVLQEIEVENCCNMEEIFTVDRADNGVIDPIFFEQLHSLALRQLPRLRSICPQMEVGSTSQERWLRMTTNASLSEIISEDQLDALPLLSEKVVFPNLKMLKLYRINLKRIWPNQLSSLSCWVQNLTRMYITDCCNLKYVFSSSTLGSFNHLQNLKIWNCKDLKELIRIDDRYSDHVKFPSLERLEIEGCSELREFIFCDKVSYPSLQEIEFHNMANLRKVWQSQVIQSVQYYPKLCKVELRNCENLEMVFPASIARSLLQLKVLDVWGCGIKEIVAKEGGVVGRFSFPQLTSLHLRSLKELRCFYPGKHATEWPKLKELEVKDCEKIELFSLQKQDVEGQLDDDHTVLQQPLFSVDQAFFELETMIISRNHNIHFRRSDLEYLFPKLKSLMIDANKSTSLPYILEKFRNLKELQLTYSSYQEILSCEEVEKHVGMFAPLKKLHLAKFYKLKQIWKQESKMDLILQKLECLEVSKCGNLINLMSPSSSFKNLKILKLDNCVGLSLVPASTIKSLMVLEEISISHCKEMTEIIANEGDVMEEGEITLSKLKSLELYDLPNLTSFYSGNYTFNFPLLERLTVDDCPKLKVFTSRDLNTPNLQEVSQDGENYKCEHIDLNATFKQICDEKVFSILEESILREEDYRFVSNLSPEQTKVFSNAKQLYLSGNDIEMMRQSQFPKHIFPNLKCFCVFEDESEVFPIEIFQGLHDLEELELFYCLYEEIFSYKEVVKYARFLTQIKYLLLHDLRYVKQMWKKDSKLNLLPNLECLEVQLCHSLINVLLSSSSFENLKVMKVSDCGKLIGLLVASIVKSLKHLEEMQISKCNMMTQVVVNGGHEVQEKITFHKLKKLELNYLPCLRSFSFENYILEIPSLEKLTVNECPNMKIFALGNLSTPILQEVWQDETKYSCNDDLNEIIRQHHEEKIFSRSILSFENVKMMLQKISEHQKVFSNLEQLSFRGDEIGMLWQSQFSQLFPQLKLIEIFEDESTIFPLAILQRFQGVETLTLNCSLYEEIFSCEDFEKYAGAFAQIKSLSLYGLDNLKQIWKQDSRSDLFLQNNIKGLQVEWCGSLVTLMPPSSSFRNLTWLTVEGCDGLMNLFAPATAKSLVQLERLEIRKCKTMTEVLSSNEEAATDDEIIFRRLESLELCGLSSLASFCAGNYTFTFPDLQHFTLKKCPKMKFFSSRVLNTPFLYQIRHDGIAYYCDDDELNATIGWIHEKLNTKTSPEDCAGPSTVSSSTI